MIPSTNRTTHTHTTTILLLRRNNTGISANDDDLGRRPRRRTRSLLLKAKKTTPDGHREEAEDEDDYLRLAKRLTTEELTEIARERRDEYFGEHKIITFSPKVFVPLTFACRDKCAYCTFVKEPSEDENMYLTEKEVLAIARKGKERGATECLFTLGDRPEAKYARAKQELEDEHGCKTTVEYVAKCARLVLEETGLLPHINCGLLTLEELRMLKKVSVSQGLMIEQVSERLMEFGMAHYNCESKKPKARLQNLRNAAKAQIPFTTGILVGIGETEEERVETLIEIRKVANEFKSNDDDGGFLGEIIVQNFRAKDDTAMRDFKEPTMDDFIRAVALARICFDKNVTIQAPPNLTPGEEDGWRLLLNAGINDFGGISPGVTPDYVSPECDWPALQKLSKICREEGMSLVPRLAAHPRFLGKALSDSGFIDEKVAPYVRALSDASGLARGNEWSPGAIEGELCGGKSANIVALNGAVECSISTNSSSSYSRSNETKISKAIAKCKTTIATIEDIALLFEARGDDFDLICAEANELRFEQCGDIVSYVINRNINYTNVCEFTCHFCAFSKGKFGETATRDKPYCLDSEEISRRTKEAWEKGATEVCMQGGIHPDFTGDSYLEFLKAAKAGAPKMHVHAFSPLEILHGATSLSISVKEFLQMLKEAGLGSLPGTAAEVLDDTVRSEICPDKLNSEEWISVIKSAHDVGIKTTSTIMFGHVDSETTSSWAKHLVQLRELHRETKGITEFVPLPFVHFKAPIYERGRSRRGPTMRECVLMHAIGRLVLGPVGITNIQASWPKMGPSFAQSLLFAGCNDVGGVLMNESITRAAGSKFGQEINVCEMESLIHQAGRTPRLRNTLYEDANEERRLKGIANANVSVVIVKT